MHVPRCRHRGHARKAGYELASSAMFKVSLKIQQRLKVLGPMKSKGDED